MSRISFTAFLSTAFYKGEYSTDDSIAFILPLFRKVQGLHEAGLVAPFDEEAALLVTDGFADIEDTLAHSPVEALYRLQSLIAIESRMEQEVQPQQGHTHKYGYLPGYNSYEQTAGHHDPLTDIFCLGLILGGMAMGLNLYEREDLSRFTRLRANPSYHYPRIHPTLGRLITEMTELDRSLRARDLYEVIRRLEHYRDYDPEKQADLGQVAGWFNKDLKQRDAYILNKLRNRLFDTSRRNRLLYFKPNTRFVNLTVGSVPLVLHDNSIRPDLLFTWNEELAEKITGMKEIVLNKYLRTEDHGYLPVALDTARVASQRDIQEYGFSQLKLVIAFLSWHNLKDDPLERIQSPLLLLPAVLKKIKKPKEDHFVLKVLDNAAEVNPVLASELASLYGIRLPEFIDLEEISPVEFYDHVRMQVEEANQGIVLRRLDRPDITNLHSEARQMVAQYLKKQRPQPGPGEENPGGPADRPGTTVEQAAEDAVIPQKEGPDPHTWDFNVCHMVLGNFHYKKMSLVRDYNVLMDRRLEHHVFDALFSEEPRTFPGHAFDPNRPDDWYHVITADPTQTRAILQSRAGYSYIIQGPPGTGKSQTITNLIADFVARGSTILFVCEKRAALDVVYHRLKQVGLEELCCYIHDSQGDKREFIRNLKATYEDFTQNFPDLAQLKARRQAIVGDMNDQIQLIRDFHEGSRSEGKDTGVELRVLIDRLIALRQDLAGLTPQQEEELPSYREWLDAGPVAFDLAAMLEETGSDPVFSHHPFSRVKETLFFSTTPHREIGEALEQALAVLEEVNTILSSIRLDPAIEQDPERLKNLVQFAILLYPLAAGGHLALADPDQEEAKELGRGMLRYRQLQEAHQYVLQRNIHWKQKLEEHDLESALVLAVRHEGRFFAGFNGPWQKLKRQLKQRYDFPAHAVTPSITHLLEGLKAEYTAAGQVQQARRQLQDSYQLENIDTAWRTIDLLQSKKGHPELDWLLRHPDSKTLVISLQALHQPLGRLETQLKRCLQEPPTGNIAAIGDELMTLQMNIHGLTGWLPVLRAFSGMSPAVKNALRRLPLRVSQLEAVTARKALQDIYLGNRALSAIDRQVLEKAAGQLGEDYLSLQKLNAGHILATVRHRFLQRLDLSGRAASQLDEEQKKFKKTYTEGRKILENEFGKSMRHKSIRELSEKESGLVLKDIKPVWLMSPYSVSDSLPLDVDHFDVVIFDEASQITLEEGVPALYRSRQAIIVGDEKQMPPTDFFSTGSKDMDPDDLDKTEGWSPGEWLSDDTDSLLAQGARKLGKTLLSWHYRSRFETLISYSNHAFYEGGLLTIPDKTIHHRERAPIRAANPEDAVLNTGSLFDRSISYHLMTESVYEKRSNVSEAGYIARLVRELLNRGVRESIGIVAFSQEQQHMIETSLDALAAEDAGFAQKLEEAYNRTENDQFTGLIVKNLENIQGDERDIIIMSVCYGFDGRRRMLMNFGPVNKRGGEKRLNVLFSRARMHMAVISSIRYEHITNEYNEGAGYLRRFLQYAELVSEGRMAQARTILDGLIPSRIADAAALSPAIVRQQVKDQLEARGYEVAEQVGQSDFKCSLAVKTFPEDEHYSLGILIDDEQHYCNPNLVEQYYQRPAILRGFGWKVMAVYAKDWLHQPQKVMEQLLKALGPGRDNGPFDGIGEAKATGGGHGYDHLEFRRLVHSGESIFWEAATEGSRLIVRRGKTGARGQVILKTFPDPQSADEELKRQEEQQKQKGFQPDQEPR